MVARLLFSQFTQVKSRNRAVVDERGRRRMARPGGVDRKATVTQMTTLYNRGEQKSNTTC